MKFMFSEYSKLLNCEETLRNNIEIFIEAFVEYYGEEERQEIEEKFRKTLLIAYKSPESTKRIIYQLENLKSAELKSKLFKDIDSIYTSDMLLKDYSYDLTDLMPITDLKNFINLFKLGKEKRKEEFINKGVSIIRNNIPEFSKEDLLYFIKHNQLPEKYSNIPIWLKNNISYYADLSIAEKDYEKLFKKVESLLKKANPNITIENFGDYLEDKEIKNLLTIIDKFDNQIEEYNEFLLSIESYKKEEKEIEELYSKISIKYYKEYIRENLDLIPEEKRKNLDKFLNDENEDYLNNEFISKLLGYSLNGITLLSSFYEDADKILEDNKPFWKIEQIKRERILYFNNLGITIEGDYEDYIKNSKVQELWPSKERINKFITSKNELINKFNIEYNSSLSSYKKMRKEIDSLNLLNKDDLFDESLYEKKATLINPNLRKNGSSYELFPLIAIFCGSQTDYLDARIVHELNHLYEMELLEVNDKEYVTSCGWEKLVDNIVTEKTKDIDTLNKDRDIRPYELFNEIINELISQDISGIMHKNNKHVFNSKYRAKIKDGTSYEAAFFLVKDFFEEYKDKIKKSRKNGNIEIIWNEVGKENFDELNSLFKIFNDNFSGMRVYSVLADLKNNIDNEKTRLYNSLIIRRDEILEKMKNYKKLNNIEEKKI